VFIDADKTRFLQYIEACLTNDKVLKRGGIMIVDNVLWKGLVLDVGSLDEVTENTRTQNDELKRSRRARKLATTVHNFNSAIVEDDRVEVLMLPIRDGLSIIRKK
jgi:caffeoyl-CoA O-methyltransferase